MDVLSSYTIYVGCFREWGKGFLGGLRSLLCQWWVRGLEQYH